MPARQALMEYRDQLLTQYTPDMLKASETKALGQLQKARAAREAMGHCSHNFDGMEQAVQSLFEEIRINLAELRQPADTLPDTQLEERCRQADPEYLLNHRLELMARDNHIPSHRRPDAELPLHCVAENLGVKLAVPEVKAPGYKGQGLG